MNAVTLQQPYWKRWSVVTFYAIAMAWVEAAVVYYLRTMVHRIDPYQENPLPIIGGIGSTELVREFATLMMLLTVGILAGRNWRSRIGYSAIAFGVWDVCYYAFLKVMCGWPKSLVDWDILFLLPLPWWGPVYAPMLIALLMIVWGTLASRYEGAQWIRFNGRRVWVFASAGILLALYLFMADAIRVTGHGVDAVSKVLPSQFQWPWFCLALSLMAAPIVHVIRQLRFQQQPKPALMEPAGNLS